MGSGSRLFLRWLMRALILASTRVVDARGPSRLRLRLHRLRVRTAPLGTEL